jgi:hypothetical protein
MDNTNIWRQARLMIEVYGEDAPIRAAMRARALHARGDVEEHAEWISIASAISVLLNPNESGVVH